MGQKREKIAAPKKVRSNKANNMANNYCMKQILKYNIKYICRGRNLPTLKKVFPRHASLSENQSSNTQNSKISKNLFWKMCESKTN